jgi:hypothetical protein
MNDTVLTIMGVVYVVITILAIELHYGVITL